MAKNIDRENVTNPKAVPWRPEIIPATLTFRGNTYSGLFYQMHFWPQLEPTSEYVFESPKLNLYISAGKKAGPTNGWIPESQEYVGFDQFSIVSGGTILTWWEEWWSHVPQKGEGKTRHLRLV